MSVDPRLARLGARAATPNPPLAPAVISRAAPVASPSTPPQLSRNLNDVSTSTDGSLDNPANDTPTATTPAATTTTTTTSPTDNFKLKFCTVCASNNNRSMEAHLRLSTSEKQYPVISFGTGSLVRLPGPSISKPQIYNFNTTSYDLMHDELQAQDARLYRNNGILNMLDRNRNIKWGPERFQDWTAGLARLDALNRGDKGAMGTEGGVVDVIFTCEERCWDAVVDNLLERGAPLNRPVHVFNVDIRDNHEEALVGGQAILELADALNAAAVQERSVHGGSGWENGMGSARENFDDKVPDILAEWQTKWPNLPAQWTLSWL